MTRTQRFVSGFANGYAHLVVATLAGLVLTPLFLARLGTEAYGLWIVGSQLLAYFLLLDLGVVALVPRETAYLTGATGRREAPAVRALIEKTLAIALVQTPFVAVAAAAVLWGLPAGWQPLRPALTIVLAAFVLTFPLRVFQAALSGLQDLAFVARVQFAGWAAGTLASAVLVVRGHGLLALGIGWCVTQGVVVAACAVRLARAFPAAFPGRPRVEAGPPAGRYLVQSAWVSVSQVSQVLLNGTDVMLVAALMGPSAVVTYTCTAKLIAVLANQPQALLQTAAPALSELRTREDASRLFPVSAALAQATLALSGLIACVVLAVNGGFVAWWVGADRFGGFTLTALLLGAMVARHVNVTHVYALFCFGHERRLAITGLADGVSTLAFTAIGLAMFGLPGAPLGAIAAVLLVGGPLNLTALARQATVPPARILGALWPWFWRCGVVALLSAAAGRALGSAGVPLLAAGAAAIAAAYAAIVGPAVLRSPAGPYVAPLLARARAVLRMTNGTRAAVSSGLR